MKYIRKAGEPHDYRNWCKLVRGTPQEDYRELQNPEKASLHEALVAEQGGLCAYTMRRVAVSSSHIEHIKPETLCRNEQVGSDLDYMNLVACFPREGMREPYRYGAQKKADWWEDNGISFVSPLDPNCEKRFRFDIDGKIAAVRRHSAATATIEILCLDHSSLVDDRNRVILEVLYGPDGDDPLSLAKARQLMLAICQRNGEGNFYEFCVAIRDAIEEHLAYLGKIARRRKFARRKNKDA